MSGADQQRGIGAAAIGVIAGLAIACAAPAQVRGPQLQPVEQGVADVGPLGVSTRLMPLDLRQPTGFDRVYRVPGSTRGVGVPGAATDDRFARVSGGVTAVFPRSQYDQSRSGIVPSIPPGTVFYIGRSPLDGPAAAPRRQPGLLSLSTSVPMGLDTTLDPVPHGNLHGPLDMRARPELEPPRPATPAARSERRRPTPVPLAANVLADEQFRRARLRQLLASAE